MPTPVEYAVDEVFTDLTDQDIGDLSRVLKILVLQSGQNDSGTVARFIAALRTLRG